MKSPTEIVAGEVHRKAVQNVANEMAISLMRTSGAAIVTENGDFSVSLMDTTPEHLACFGLLPHVGASLIGTQSIKAVASAGEIEAGSGWIVNDPHTGGALHQGDVGIAMPISHEAEIVGWSFVNTHVLDMGGSAISSFAPGAKSSYEETLLFPPMRIIEDGEIDPEWVRFLQVNVRTPGPVLNDLRSMIAANNTAAQKLVSIIDHYGLDRHQKFCERAKLLGERLLRARIEALPDGRYSATDWLELERLEEQDELVEFRVELDVKGSDLYFCFSADEQVDAFFNTTGGTVLGFVLAEVVRVLGYGDLPINAGLWRPVHVDMGESGTVINCTPPAPVSYGNGSTGPRIGALVRDVLTQALTISRDRDLRRRVAGRAVDHHPASAFFGGNQHGGQSVLFYVDSAVGVGGPAQAIRDGQDTFGFSVQVGGGLADVETHETQDPVLFLWRRLLPDSGAPGEMRGGLGMEQAFTPWGNVGPLSGPIWHDGRSLPVAGVGGGFPGAPGGYRLLTGTNVTDLLQSGHLPQPDTVEGVEKMLGGLMQRVTLDHGDAWIIECGGGSGLGDPLRRAPSSVARDVSDEIVSQQIAKEVYGVVLTPTGDVDMKATDSLRFELRRRRLGGKIGREPSIPVERGISVVLSDGMWECASCNLQLGSSSINWREAGITVTSRGAAEGLEQAGMRVRSREHPSIFVQEFICPGCASLLAVDVVAEEV